MDGGSTPSTPQTPVTPLPLLASARRARERGNEASQPHDQAQLAAVKAPHNTMLAKCFSLDNYCGASFNEHTLDMEPPSACAHPPLPSVSLTRKVGAEFIGTFMLIFAGAAAAIVNEKTGGAVTLVGAAAASGLAVMIIILAVGHISGAHLNPCLTISFATFKHFPWIQVPAYLAAQVAGSICASFALKGIFSPFMHGGVTVPSGSIEQSFFLEFIISFNLMFVVTAVATDCRAVGELAGIAVGATVMMNILIGGPTSGASMNPVRSLGPAIAANNYRSLWLYIVAPISGALFGIAAYTLVKLKENDAPANNRSGRSSFRR